MYGSIAPGVRAGLGRSEAKAWVVKKTSARVVPTKDCENFKIPYFLPQAYSNTDSPKLSGTTGVAFFPEVSASKTISPLPISSEV